MTRRHFTTCPNCQSNNITTSSTVAIIRTWDHGKQISKIQVTTDAGSTRCLKCQWMEHN